MEPKSVISSIHLHEIDKDLAFTTTYIQKSYDFDKLFPLAPKQIPRNSNSFGCNKKIFLPENMKVDFV